MNFELLTIKDLKILYLNKSLSFMELIELQIAYINKSEEKILSLVKFDEELYLRKAKDFDSQIMSEG